MIVHLELVIGKEVRDEAGRRAGRIAEVHGVEKGHDFVITHYTVIVGWIGFLRHELGFRRWCRKRRVPWDKMDLRDPLRPRVTCSVEELKAAR